MRSMKHADCPPGCTTGKSQLRFATRKILLTGFCITYHGGKPRDYDCLVGGGLLEGQGLEGLQGLARLTPCTMG